MLYRYLADAIVIIHFIFIIFVIFGGFLVLRWRWIIWMHIPAAMWGVIIEFSGWICPLTPLENWLRNLYGLDPYDMSFVEHYIIPLIYPIGLTREVQIILGVLVVTVNLIIYWYVFFRNIKLVNKK